MFDAVLFDLDGTLIDTESVALVAGLRAFAAFGYQVEDSFMHSLVGKAEPVAETIIRAAYPQIDQAAFSAKWREGFQAGLEAGVPLKSGTFELIGALSLPLGIVTSSGRDSAHWKLDRAGLTPHFETVVTFDDVTAAKPAPEPYLLAAARMGVDPTRCVVFEDSDIGAEAAHQAGCIVVQVPDIAATRGQFARHLAPDLLAGARLVGLI